MSLLGFLRNKKISTGEVVDSAISGIDKLFYTKEEKIDDLKKVQEVKFKVAEAVSRHAENTMNENTERSKFRRSVGNKVINVFFLLTVHAGAVAYVKPEMVDLAIKLMEFWSSAFIATIAFLFTGHYLRETKVGEAVNNYIKKKNK